MDERWLLRMTAEMEGEATVVKDIGQRVKVSQMELIILCNLAQLTCWHELSRRVDDEGLVAQVTEARDELVQNIREQFRQGQSDGLARLIQACVAMLAQERLGKYLVTREQGETEAG